MTFCLIRFSKVEIAVQPNFIDIPGWFPEISRQAKPCEGAASAGRRCCQGNRSGNSTRQTSGAVPRRRCPPRLSGLGLSDLQQRPAKVPSRKPGRTQGLFQAEPRRHLQSVGLMRPKLHRVRPRNGHGRLQTSGQRWWVPVRATPQGLPPVSVRPVSGLGASRAPSRMSPGMANSTPEL